MTFKVVQDAVRSLINTMEQTAVLSVRALKTNTFDVKVKNLPKTQTIKGTVTVGNQNKLEAELRELRKATKEITKSVQAIKIPEPERFPEIKFPTIPEPLRTVSVDNFPTVEIPKEMRVSNQPVRELKQLEGEIKKLNTAIKALKLNPNINVQAPKSERIVIPPAQVNVEQIEIDYKKLSQSIASQIPGLDYEKLALTLSKELGQMVITSGSGGGKYAFKDAHGRFSYAQVDATGAIKVQATESAEIVYAVHNIDDGEPMYIGKLASGGQWQITKIVLGATFTYASGTANYSTNWTNRASLTYGEI